nr:N-acetylmuramoyl-L-alanine amidase [Bacteroidales bacterium]
NLEQSVRFAQAVEKHLKGGPIVHDRGLSQDPFLVLWRTAMPAVLLELGFISNDTDLAALRQKENRDQLAERICQAFIEYKQIYDGTVDAPSPDGEKPKAIAPKTAPAPAPPAAKGDDGTVYAVQIFAVKKKMDPKSREFMGYTPRIIQSGSLYKYYIGVSNTAAGSKKHLSAIRKKYPDAFLVRITGDKAVRVE